MLHTLRECASGNAAKASSPQDYLRALDSATVDPDNPMSPPLFEVRVRLSSKSNETVDVRLLSDQQIKAAAGYAVHLRGDTGTAGRPIYYSGSKLGEDLSLGQLKKHWQIEINCRRTTDGPKPATSQTVSQVQPEMCLETGGRTRI